MIVGTVVSKPTARNTTGRLLRPGHLHQLARESTRAVPGPSREAKRGCVPTPPGTFIRSPKVATWARPDETSWMALSM